WNPRSGSAKANGFQVLISLNDLAQLVFRRAVAAVGIGMMPFHQRLEPDLDIVARGLGLKAQRVQRLALGIAHAARLARAAAVALGPPAAELAKQAERVVGVAQPRMQPRRMRARG